MFRGLISGIVVFAFCASVFAQPQIGDAYTPEYLNKKIQHYRRKQIAGGIMLGVGAGLIAGSIPMINSAKWETQTSATGTQISTSDSKGGIGVFMLIVGIPSVIVGPIIAIVGTRQKHIYKRLKNEYIVPAEGQNAQ